MVPSPLNLPSCNTTKQTQPRHSVLPQLRCQLLNNQSRWRLPPLKSSESVFSSRLKVTSTSQFSSSSKDHEFALYLPRLPAREGASSFTARSLHNLRFSKLFVLAVWGRRSPTSLKWCPRKRISPCLRMNMEVLLPHLRRAIALPCTAPCCDAKY